MKFEELGKTKNNREKRVIAYFSLFILSFAIIAAISGQYSFLIALVATESLVIVAHFIGKYLSADNRKPRLLNYIEKPIGLIAISILIFVIVLVFLNRIP